ncbi:MAG: helix-turn-helix transcriptional regulator [Selenomonadaceae bacterium]|nr:helix-turn-helix transcriptional regulator [Selenomonadaceae bacterium]
MLLPLKQLREDKGITQSELSKIMNVSSSTIGMWEQGRREPDYVNLKKLADFFHVTTDYLLSYNDLNTKTPPSTYNEKRTELLKAYDGLNADGQILLIGMLNLLRESHGKKVAVN